MLKFYNTYTKKIEEFKPIEDKKIRMYNCGPTVYDYVHIGNFRTYLMADFLRRTLEYLGYEVKQIKNITDVGHLTQEDIEAGEDKMIKAAKREKKSPFDIARFYESAFRKDEKKLNILPAHKFPRATEYIPQMIEMIKKLIEKGYAYEVNGSVFYDVEKFENYGKLSGNTLENLLIGARLEVHPDKKHPYDFALWLKADPGHLMQWDSPWKKGYPGWHIECSAMSSANLGETLDIHTGGEDNIFPHHEDEIAQSEGVSGKKFVNYWIHGRHLMVDGEKMSKSKGNFYSLADIEKKGFSPLSFRYLCLTAHFQSKLNFTWKSLKASQKTLDRLCDFIRELHIPDETESIQGLQGPSETKCSKAVESHMQDLCMPPRSPKETIEPSILDYEEKFKRALENNLDIPKALSFVWEVIKSDKISNKNKKETLLKFDKVLGLDLDKVRKEKLEIPEEIIKLAEERKRARKDKDWVLADKLRKEIEKAEFVIEDTAGETKIKKK